MELYEYVRRSDNSWSPEADMTSQDFICNEGGLNLDTMANTKTVQVAPGEILGFTVNIEIGHPGPLAVYMSKAPDDVEAKDYKGDGDWFKIYAPTVPAHDKDTVHWANYRYGQAIRNYTLELPHDAKFAKAQFYISCAQLEVTGNGNGKPSPTVKIPGVYDGREHGILMNIFNPIPTNYDAPGPVTWPLAWRIEARIFLMKLGTEIAGGESWEPALGRKHTGLSK